jgi:ribonuclease P protein component
MSKLPTLKSRSQFERVYSQGNKQVRQHLVLFHLKEASEELRIAYVASRKVGGAVQRNRAKRVLRAAFQQVEATTKIPEGWWVLVARRAILQYKSHQVADQLLSVVKTMATDSSSQPPPNQVSQP